MQEGIVDIRKELANSTMDYFEIPIKIMANWYFTASSSDNYAAASTDVTLVYRNGELKVIGTQSCTAVAPASRYSKATASITVGEIVT